MIPIVSRVRRGIQRRWAEQSYRRFQRLPEVEIRAFVDSLPGAGGTVEAMSEPIAVVLPDVPRVWPDQSGLRAED